MRWERVKTSDKLLTPCQYTYTAYQPEVARISTQAVLGYAGERLVIGWNGVARWYCRGVVQLTQRGLTCRSSHRRPVIVPETPCK
jgi:hypothetical protein